MASGPPGLQNWLCDTISDASPCQNTPTDSAEEPKWLQLQSSLHIVTSQRDHMLLNYFLRCPLSGFLAGRFTHLSE